MTKFIIIAAELCRDWISILMFTANWKQYKSTVAGWVCNFKIRKLIVSRPQFPAALANIGSKSIIIHGIRGAERLRRNVCRPLTTVDAFGIIKVANQRLRVDRFGGVDSLIGADVCALLLHPLCWPLSGTRSYWESSSTLEYIRDPLAKHLSHCMCVQILSSRFKCIEDTGQSLPIHCLQMKNASFEFITKDSVENPSWKKKLHLFQTSLWSTSTKNNKNNIFFLHLYVRKIYCVNCHFFLHFFITFLSVSFAYLKHQ